VTIVVFPLDSISVRFFYEEFDVGFDLSFFAPLFIVEDKNSSALGVIGIGFAEILTPSHSFSDSQG